MMKKLHDLFQPSAYKLSLNIDSSGLKFSGRVGIRGKNITKVSEISLHSKELTILAASIDGKEVTFHETEFDTLVLMNDEVISEGEVEVALEFTGKVTDAMHGMYPCYFEHEGKKKKLIATQFESHHAREVFPCIDEPAAKATFELELITPAGETVLANTPIKSQRSEHERLITQFETTPRMSSYLLAFVFGEMVSKEATTKDGVLVRSWASAAQDPDWLDFSLAEAVHYIEFYNDYFGVPYPLEKCDQVALPDFESGAMENWGLITYRESALLSDPKNVSLSTQQLVAIVVAHELSHQWFGNLVTMAWWDDLWLNESFASMTEYIAVDALHPEWVMWEEFIGHDGVAATNRDVYSDVQPVRVAVNNPEEIHTLFDPAIVYAKGGKLLKTLRDLLGDDAWRAGLTDYFTQHAYQNTTRDDLWAALSKHSQYDITKLMNTWLEHSGQPLVTVTQNGINASIIQQRILLDGKKDSVIWQIPLLAENAPDLFTDASGSIDLTNSDWLKLNSTGVGHYVVNYTNPEHKKALASQIADPEVSSSWKITRLNELVMLARHGEGSLQDALEAIKSSQHEPRAAVWSQIAGILGNARMMIEGKEQLEKRLKKFTFQLIDWHYTQLGWEYNATESSNETHLRTTALALAVSSEVPEVVSKALELYGKTKDHETLPAELRSILMGTAVRHGRPEEFSELVETYKNANSADYKNDICAALTSTRQPKDAQQLLDLMLSTDVIRPQDTARWYIYLLRNRYTRDLAWNWLKTNWTWILENFGGSKSYDDFARYSANFFNTTEALGAYREFFEPKKSDPALKRAITIGIEEIKARSAWKQRDQAMIAEWLKEYSAEN